MVENTKDNGTIIIWKAWEYILGQMAGDMKESIKMTKSMGMGSILGLTIGTIKVGGAKVNNTV